jgi:hypothetical protein
VNDVFKTKEMSAEQVMREALAVNGGGINTTIPMTLRQYPAQPKKQLLKDNKIVKELVYLCDVLNRKDEAVELFFQNKNRLSDPCFWELLRTMWILNGKRENLLMFRQLFQSKRPFKRFLMTIEEKNIFNALPDLVIAYRAPMKDDDVGISWTLSKEFVERYAKHTGREIIEATISKTEIVAFFDRRGEQEIILLKEVKKS